MLLMYSGRNEAKNFLIVIAVILLSFACSSENQNEMETNPALINAAEDLNHILPQRQGLDTFLDSVTVNLNRMNYYYSLAGLTLDQYHNESLHDSLYKAAIERIPCSLWRPEYMQGVDVSFTYFSSDGEELIQFTESQGTCH